MSIIGIIALAIGAFVIGAIITWLVVRSLWVVKLAVMTAKYDSAQQKLEAQSLFIANSEKAMKDAFGSLAADALHQNNQAFVTLAESKLSEKVTEAKGILEGKEKAIDGLVKPLTESMGKLAFGASWNLPA